MNLSDTFNNLTSVSSEDVDEHDDEKGVVIAKATAMTVLFLASTFFGLLPYKLSKWFNWQEASHKTSIVIPLLLSFGGGVLLSTTFLHLLPEVSVNIKELQESKVLPDLKFHLAEFLMCMGFFAMYFVEECVHIYLKKRETLLKSSENAFRRGHSIRGSALMKIRGKEEIISNGNSTISTVELVSPNTEFSPNDRNSGMINKTIPHYHIHDNENGVHTHLPQIDDNIVSGLRGLLIVLALSVHELFEGLAVGLESSESTVWYMFGAVSAHKLVLAFCVGVELVVTHTRFVLMLIYVITFAIVSPIGIGIGILLSDNPEGTAIPSVILQGLATGTLLYVVFFEILSKTTRSDLRQYFVVLFGFLLMFGLQFASKFILFIYFVYLFIIMYI